MKRISLRVLFVLAAAPVARANYFPIDFDVHPRLGILMPRPEGLFLYQPSAGKVNLIHAPRAGVPVFARFLPSGKEVVVVINEAKDLFENKLRIDIVPVEPGPVRTVHRGKRASDVQVSPDGTKLSIIAVVDTYPHVYELRLIDIASGKERSLLKGADWKAHWFADSRRLLMITGKEELKDHTGKSLARIAIIDAADGKLAPLASVCIGKNNHLALSPDNRKILFTAFAAEKADAKPAVPQEAKSKLFELDTATMAIRAIDKEAEFVRYSPGGKKVLLTGGGYSFQMRQNLEIGDAGLTSFQKLAADSYAPAIHFDSSNLLLPGLVHDDEVYYFTMRRVFGVENMALHMILIGADGKGRRDVQPDIDEGVLRELARVGGKPRPPTRVAFSDVRKRGDDAKVLITLKKLGLEGSDGAFGCNVSLNKEHLTPDGQIKPELLQVLSTLSKVERLSTGFGTDFSEVGLAGLKQLKGLRHLNLAIGKSTRAGLAHLKTLTQLRELELSAGFEDILKLDDAALENFRGLTNLERLVLHGHQITDNGLAHLKGLNKLQELHVNVNQLGDAALEHLKDLSDLKTLDLGGNRLAGQGLVHLRGLANLEYLYLKNNQITDAGLRDLKDLPLPVLRSLDLSNNQLDGKRLAWLKGCTNLEFLELSDNEMADLTSLSGLPKLRELILVNSDASDAGMIHLKTHLELTKLDLSNTLVGDAGLKELAELPQLEVLHLSGTAVTDAGLAHLAKMPRLRTVWLPRRVTSDAINRLKKQLPKLDVEKN